MLEASERTRQPGALRSVATLLLDERQRLVVGTELDVLRAYGRAYFVKRYVLLVMLGYAIASTAVITSSWTRSGLERRAGRSASSCSVPAGR